MSTISRGAQATLLLVGTVVGVGMFGIPFVFARAGFSVGAIELVLLTAAILVVHLAYGDIVVRSPRIHRLPGYVRLILGPLPGRIAELSHFLGLSGALLAYLVIGGSFLGVLLQSLLGAIPPWFGTFAFFAFGSFVIWKSIRFEGLVNSILTLGLIGVTLGITAALLAHGGALPAAQPGAAIVPYGVLLFALAGGAVIPDVCRLSGARHRHRLRSIIVLGSVIPAILYLSFAFAVVGATGSATTPDAVTGLATRLGIRFGLVGSAVGFLAAITSFIGLGLTLKGMFRSDLGFKPHAARLAAPILPAILFLSGFQDFITILSVVGAVAIGVDSILILWAQRRLSECEPVGGLIILPEGLRAIAVGLFTFGVVHELLGYLNFFP